MIRLDWLQHMTKSRLHEFSEHAFDECEDERITAADIESAILNGEILEQYEQRRHPRGDSCLVLGPRVGGGYVHVVLSKGRPEGEMRVVTAYLPRPPQWIDKRRRGAR